MVYTQLIALAALPGALAAPRPQIAPIASQPFYCPILDKSEEINGKPWQIGRSVDGVECESLTPHLPSTHKCLRTY